jgi:hypothetical protein
VGVRAADALAAARRTARDPFVTDDDTERSTVDLDAHRSDSSLDDLEVEEEQGA